MGSLIHYEGWDGVSAPSIPSGWTVSSPLATKNAPFPLGVSPITNPNVIGFSASGTATHYPATYGTADSASGNVLVYASFIAAATSNVQTCGVFCRASAYPVVLSSSSYYWATISLHGGTCVLYAVDGGTQTSLGSIAISGGLSDTTWYQLSLYCVGTSILVYVVDTATGYWLNPSGTFQSAAVAALSVVDSSISGSGYAGLTIASESDATYSDEWYFYQYTATPQPSPLRPMPIAQRALARGRLIQPLAVRFGTPALPLSPFTHGIVWRDHSRRKASINHGWTWLPAGARNPIPPQVPFAFWQTIKRLDTSKLQRRIAPGRVSTPQSFARLGPPPQVPFAWWPTIRWRDPSERLRQINAGRAWCPGAALVPGAQIYEGFTQQYITSVNPPVQYGTELYLSWTSNAPPGLVYQVYENDALVWHGSSTYCTLPSPQCMVRFDIGTVGSAYATTSFGYELPPAPLLQAELNWLGGTFEAPDIAGFYVYGEESPGGGIDYTTPLATIPAYTAGVITDGYGYGGYGQGGFGEAAGSYSWTSQPLSTGTWYFAVVPFDTSGNQGTGAVASVQITAPPGEPPPFSDRTRLHYSYNPALYEVTLQWNPSPG